MGPTNGPMDFILQGTKAGPCSKVGIKLGPKSPPDGLKNGWAEQLLGPNIKWPIPCGAAWTGHETWTLLKCQVDKYDSHGPTTRLADPELSASQNMTWQAASTRLALASAA